MIRGSDPLWCYVEQMADGFLKCVFCGRIFFGSTSITRIKYHLARVKGGGTKLCEKVTPDVQRAAFDQLPNRMHGSMPSSSKNIIVTAGSDRAKDLEIQGQPLLDDGLSWMDSLIGGEILLTDENVAPGMLIPETGLGTEPADQPFEMDVEFSSSIEKMTRELMQSVAERGSSSKRPVDRRVPSSSNNEATNAASTPVRGLAVEQPRSDDGLGGMDILIRGETEFVQEPRAPVVLMTDEPETRQRTEQAHQSFEMNTKCFSPSSMMDAFFSMCRKIVSGEYKHSVVQRGSSSKSPVHKRRRTRRYVLPTTKLVGQAFERNMKDVWSWFLNDEVSCIGIYGMGGVGKTALAAHMSILY